MNHKEITTRLESLLEAYDKVSPEWAKAKAEHQKFDELKKITLSVIASSFEGGSEAERTRKAYKSEKYLAWLETSTDVSQTFYELDAKKKGIETKVDVYRSLLSFEKSMIDLTQ